MKGAFSLPEPALKKSVASGLAAALTTLHAVPFTPAGMFAFATSRLQTRDRALSKPDAPADFDYLSDMGATQSLFTPYFRLVRLEFIVVSELPLLRSASLQFCCLRFLGQFLI
jgi:hypothetical protein